MGKYTEKELERLNHSQLCDILKENEVEFNASATKAELRAAILGIEDSTQNEETEIQGSNATQNEETEIQDSNDTISEILKSRRESVKSEETTVDQKIAARRAQFGSGRAMSIRDAIAARRKKI